MNAGEILARLPYLAGLPDRELERLSTLCNIADVAEGTVVIEQGADPGDLFVVVEGSFRAVRKGPNGDVVLGTSGVGQVIGEMSLLEDRPTSAEVTAVTPGKLLIVPGSEIQSLVASPEMANAILRTITSRLREREAALVQAEKLAALGTLTAGLLHEVNNPAAALIRAGTGLEEAITRLTPNLSSTPLSALQKSDRARVLGGILASTGVDPKLASSLVAQGWDEAALRAIPEPEIQQAADLAHIRQLASEVVMAATRLSELVGTVKRWTFHDQGELNSVDLVTVVSDSLTLLSHKAGSLRVTANLGESVSIDARGGELSQVVTNVIDNAIDAAVSGIDIHLTDDGKDVTLIIEDDGSGIPTEKLDKIWEPFFTTKPPGKGTGLGLAISQRIVNDHGGSITVDSEPGRTRFVIRLPSRRGS